MDYYKPRTPVELAAALASEAARLGVTVDHPFVASHVVDEAARRRATAAEITAALAAECVTRGKTEQHMLWWGKRKAAMDPDGRLYFYSADVDEADAAAAFAERVRRRAPDLFDFWVDDLRRGPPPLLQQSVYVREMTPSVLDVCAAREG